LRPHHHLSASLLFSAATYAVTSSPLLTAANFLTGVFVDIDHIPEYLIKSGFKLSPSEFYAAEMHLTGKKSVLLLHGFDVVTLGFGLLFFSGSHALAWAVYLGAMQHLLLDLLYNPVRMPWTFFLAYRIFHGFDNEKLFLRVDMKTFRKGKRGGGASGSG
jgi:hypothetical protein